MVWMRDTKLRSSFEHVKCRDCGRRCHGEEFAETMPLAALAAPVARSCRLLKWLLFPLSLQMSAFLTGWRPRPSGKRGPSVPLPFPHFDDRFCEIYEFGKFMVSGDSCRT